MIFHRREGVRRFAAGGPVESLRAAAFQRSSGGVCNLRE